jgi:hypothetical protein
MEADVVCSCRGFFQLSSSWFCTCIDPAEYLPEFQKKKRGYTGVFLRLRRHGHLE